MNLKIHAIPLLAAVAFVSCSDSPDNNNGADNNGGTAVTEVQFDAGAQLQVQVGDGAPNPEAVTGTITNTDGLASYIAYYTHQGGSRQQIGDKVDLAGADSYNFSITDVPYPDDAAVDETGKILLKVIPAHGNTKNAELSVLFTAYEDSDTEYNYTKLPDDLGITEAKAFPTAEGYGSKVTGGRGGDVYVVTTLADTDLKGSLRYAVESSGARTIVFQVGGYIDLKKELQISSGNITIAGQTAPGSGICLRGNNLRINEGVNNVIIRYLRIRPSVGSGEYDAAWGRYASNIIIDHCSFSWANDEVASFYANENFTMQYCIVGESFYHSTHPKGNHGYGGIWGGKNVTFHHNLITSNSSRNPRLDGNRKGTGMNGRDVMDFTNNVIFNWGDNSMYGGEGSSYNIVNNYYKPGPGTKNNKLRIFELYDPTRASDDGATSSESPSIYITGNVMEGNSPVTVNNLLGLDGNKESDEKVRTDYVTAEPVATFSHELEDAESAYANVLASVGASLVYDAVDARIIESAATGKADYGGTWGSNTGIIDNPEDVGGYPELKSGAVTDNDGDGMADKWEELNGLDPSKDDANAYTLNEYYTNIEMFANSFVDFK